MALPEERIDVWAEEGGYMLEMHKQPNGAVIFQIVAVSGAEQLKVGKATIARFRLPRIAAFLSEGVSRD